MKHIELKMLVIQEWLAAGRLQVNKISTHWNPSDLLTKGLPEMKLVRFGRMLRLRGQMFDNSAFDGLGQSSS